MKTLSVKRRVTLDRGPKMKSGSSSPSNDSERSGQNIIDAVNLRPRTKPDCPSKADEVDAERAEIDVVDLTATSALVAASDVTNSDDLPSKHRSIDKLPALKSRQYYGKSSAASVRLDNRAAGMRPMNSMKPNSARTAEIIKARYIRSAQQYRKICSLIELLASQHNKLEVRRQQLQRTMNALSAMYRLNKTQSAPTTTPTADGTSSSSPQPAVSMSASTTSPPLQFMTTSNEGQLTCQTSSTNLHQSIRTAANEMIPVDFVYSSDVIGDYELEPEATQNMEAEDLSLRWYTTNEVADHAPTSAARPSSLTVGQQQSRDSQMTSRGTWYEEPAGYCDGKAPVNDVAAHGKSNFIDIGVDDYERPVAAHSCKADLSSYSYMQLCRQR